MTTFGLWYHPSFLEHDTGDGHPESPDRVRAIIAHLQSTDLWPRLSVMSPDLAELSTIELVHPRRHIDVIRAACEQGPTALDPDTIASPGSWQAAVRAVGAVTGAIDLAFAGRSSGAFCAVRPPGHHAMADRAMGFCLFNNVAIGARYAQRRHGISRVLILDWDVHHGNGTQAIFYDDPSVLYISSHQAPFYPGTGASTETGRGPGEGHTINLPLAPGCGDAEIVDAFERIVRPKALAFRPALVLISAGFDAHRNDPLAHLELTEAGYAALTTIARRIATETCQGRMVSALEGGYDLPALGRSVEAHLRAWMDATP